MAHCKGLMNTKTQLRVTVTDLQADILLQRLSSFPFDIEYKKERQADLVILVISCTLVQEKIVRDILHELDRF
jgi:hypothetical protein